MQFDLKPCRHHLKRPSDLVTDIEGVSYLQFECITLRVWDRSEARFGARSTVSSWSCLVGGVRTRVYIMRIRM